VPIGEYRLGTVTCAFDDAQGGSRWNFVFSDIGRRGEPHWYKIERGSTTLIDPLGDLELSTGALGLAAWRPGVNLTVQPRLFTGDGLLIAACYRGTPAGPAATSGTVATIALATLLGRTVEVADSGFG
jgi:hypothetical protein